MNPLRTALVLAVLFLAYLVVGTIDYNALTEGRTVSAKQPRRH